MNEFREGNLAEIDRNILFQDLFEYICDLQLILNGLNQSDKDNLLN